MKGNQYGQQNLQLIPCKLRGDTLIQSHFKYNLNEFRHQKLYNLSKANFIVVKLQWIVIDHN